MPAALALRALLLLLCLKLLLGLLLLRLLLELRLLRRLEGAGWLLRLPLFRECFLETLFALLDLLLLCCLRAWRSDDLELEGVLLLRLFLGHAHTEVELR